MASHSLISPIVVILLLATGGLERLDAAVSAAFNHQISLQSGRICAVGENDNGQLGDGTFIGKTRPVFTAQVSDAIAIATAENHSLAVTRAGIVWAWGNNTYGRLGDGSTATKATPVAIQELVGVVAVAAGQYHSLALKEDGSVWAWGYNGNGQVGDGTTVGRTAPVRVVGLDDVTAIAAGSEFSLALRRNGTVWAWGQNSSGQLGDGTTTRRTAPVQVAELTNVRAIAAGGFHSLAIRATDGSVWSWGSSGYGQLGNNLNRDQVRPVRAGTLTNATSVAGGWYFSLASRADGSVWAWGRNEAGQLGDRSTMDRMAPVQVRDVSGATGVAAGGSFSVAETPIGRRSWGSNSHGQLGNGVTSTGSTMPISTPACQETGPSELSFSTSPSRYAGWGAHRLSVQDGRVCSAGDNEYSQLGDGTVIDRWRPAYAATLNGALSISTSARHSLAVTADGSVWAWGNNVYGRLGDGTAVSKSRPVRLASVSNAIAVAAGEYHSLALLNDGTVMGWGYNGNGQVGDGSFANRTSPTRVIGLTDVVAISAGSEFSAALKRDGTVWTWGQNSSGQLGDRTLTRRSSPVQVAGLEGVVAIAAGGNHTLAIKGNDASVWSWGYGGYGQLGNGSTNEQSSIVRAGDLTGVVSVASGANFSLAVRADGSVWAWGRNDNGQLGDRTTVSRTAPVRVAEMTAAILASAGGAFSMIEKSDGSTWVWGDNSEGQFGSGTTTGSTTPVLLTRCVDQTASPVSTRFSAVPLAAAYDHTIALRADGPPWVSGSNASGQLGTGNTLAATPGRIAGIANVKTISTAESHSLAVTTDGSVWAWGTNSYGRLGDGTTTAKLTPLKLSTISSVQSVAAGRYHSLALKTDGTVWAWGYNGNGQLGEGSTTSRSSPVQVISLREVTAIAAGEEHSLALKSDGTVWAWGANGSGQLGNGTSARSTFPVQVSDLTGVFAIAAGSAHSLAIRRGDGSVWTWGAGSYGQLGDGGTSERYHIVRAGDLASMVAIAGGPTFTVAAKADGSVWTWGYNREGQLGNRSTDSRSVPVQVDGLATAVAVAAGESHAVALTNDGRLFAWGANDKGQYATPGSPPASTVPLEISPGFAACNCLGVDPPPSSAGAPGLTRISPNSVVAGSGDLALTVQGEGFVPESTVNWNQINLATTYVNPKELRATIGRQLLASPVSSSISVSNGSQRSNLAGFLVSAPTAPKPVPNVSGMIEPKQLAFPAPTGAIVDGVQDALFWIRNTGDQPFPFRVEVKRGEAWLTLSAANNPPVNRIEGAVQPQSAVGVTARTIFNRLSLPTENGLISVVYGPGLQAETEINVRAGSLSKPEILLSRSRIKVLATKAELDSGLIQAVPFYILNLGTTSLQWAAESSHAWLSVNPRLPPTAAGLQPVTGSTGEFPVQSVNLQVDLAALRRAGLVAVGKPAAGVIVVRDLNRSDVEAKRIEVDVEIAEGIEVSVAPTGFLFTGDLSASIEAQNLTVQSLVARDTQFQLQPSELWNTLFGRPCEPPCINNLPRNNSIRFAIRPVTLPPDHKEVITPITANLTVGFNVSGPTSVPLNRGGNWRIEGRVVRRGAAQGSANAMVSRGSSGSVRPAAADCAATLHIVTAGLPNNFLAVRTRIQRLELRVVNGCGDYVDQGTIIAIPSNGDPPVRLSPIGKGGWEGNWQSARATGDRSVRLDVLVSTPDGTEGRRSIQGTTIPVEAGEATAPTTPVVLNAASLRDENVITPGSIVSVLGTDFLDRDGLVQAETDALPTTLAGASVFMGDIRLPLLQAVRLVGDSGGGTPIDRIDAIVPYDLPVGQQLVLSVERNGLRSASAELLLADARPGLFRTSGPSPHAVAFDQDNSPITESNRAERGKSIVFHATGLGRVTAPPALGQRAKSEPLSHVVGAVRLWFGGEAVTPSFAGLTPGQAGLYQINVVVPESVKPDNGLVEVSIEVDGVRGPSSLLPVLP